MARAQEDDTRNELWPEVDTFIRFNPKARLFILAARSSATDDAWSDGSFGVHLDLSLKRHYLLPFHKVSGNVDDDRRQSISARIGYRYIASFDNGDETSTEDRGILELTFRKKLGAGILLADRNRVDLRWIDGTYSWRYRNRVTCERDVKIRTYNFTPYAAAEIAFDSRYDHWNRNRLTIGTQWPMTPKIMLDSYVTRQSDDSSNPGLVYALGLALNLAF